LFILRTKLLAVFK